MLTPYLLSGLLLLGLLFLLWLLSLALKNASIADIFWGPGFIAITWWNAWQIGLEFLTIRQVLLLSLVTIWGLRLAAHIFSRNHSRPEDFRYAAWREKYGKNWWWYSFIHVFLLQGTLLWIISIPLIASMNEQNGESLWSLVPLACAIWGLGFYFEVVGDMQLAKFKSDPANQGKIMTTGLWKYTRHPNYFGDAVQWWGFYLLAVSMGAGWTIFSPLLMTFLLVRVSGVALLEKTLQARPGYAEYARRTNAFLPWRPRH